MSRSLTGRQRLAGLPGIAGVSCLLLQACSQAPRAPEVSVVQPVPELAPPAPVEIAPPSTQPAAIALTPGEYRLQAARHVYAQHAAQVYNGALPPLLQAVGVLNVEIGAQGEVRSLNWLRAPSHVPEVMRQIEQLIHRAAPYPAPQQVHGITYTDTWLWHKSGRFQLHTLSEGQLGAIESAATSESKRPTTRRAAASPASIKTAKCAHPAGDYC
jgi:protein TonB